MATIMKALILLLLFASPVMAYDPWTDCGLWANETLCRKARAGQWEWEQQRLLEEQELAEMNKRLGRTGDDR